MGLLLRIDSYQFWKRTIGLVKEERLIGVVEVFCHWSQQKELVLFVIVGFSDFGGFFLKKKVFLFWLASWSSIFGDRVHIRIEDSLCTIIRVIKPLSNFYMFEVKDLEGNEIFEEAVNHPLKSDSEYVVVDEGVDSKVIYDLESIGIDGNQNGGHEEERFEVALGFVVAWEVELKVLCWNLSVALALALTSTLALALALALALVLVSASALTLVLVLALTSV